MLKKKKLMELPELYESPDGLCASAEVVEIDGDEILHIDVTNFGELIVRYFLDRKHRKWICFGKKAGWSKMKFESAIDYELSSGSLYGYWGGQRIYAVSAEDSFDNHSREVVEKYMSSYTTWTACPRYMINEFEVDCGYMRRQRAYDSKAQRISVLMARVPNLPADFKEWIAEAVFPERYLYTKKENGKTRYTCTACGKSGIRKMTARIGSETACPRCGKQVKVRSFSRKYAERKVDVVILQDMLLPRDKKDWLHNVLPNEKGYVERQLHVFCNESPEGAEFYVCEDIRALVRAGERWGKCYYGQETDAAPREQTFWVTNPKSRRWKSSYIYPHNLPAVLIAAGMEHSGLDILARKRIPINVDYFIVKYDKMPWIEYLIKAGLNRLVKEVVDCGMWGVPEGIVKESGNSLQECLMLDANGVNRLKQLDGGWTILDWLRVETKTKKKVSTESIKFFDRYNTRPFEAEPALMLKLFGSPNKMANYLHRQMKEKGNPPAVTLDMWNDYIDMCKKLKKPVSNEMVYRPKDLKLAHDECMALLKRESAAKRAEEVRGKFPEAEINLQMIADKYEFSDDTYCIKVPENIEDIIVEGAVLGHCIDRTDVYFDRIQNRTSFLVFLRKTERPDAPWYTLEIEPGGTIRQKRTVGNTQKDEDIKAFTPFLREWQKHVLRKMNETDRELARASREARLEEYGQLRERKEPIRRGLLAGQLLADVLEADLMEAI